MRPELDALEKWGALHQVWFVRNYYRLVFEQAQRIDVHCDSEVRREDGRVFERGADGFSDALVACIDARVHSINYQRLIALDIEMSSGSIIRLKLSPDNVHGPEAFEIDGCKDLGVYIEFNA